MPENTLVRMELKVSNSFSGYSDENVVVISIRTVDCRKGVVGRGICDVISDFKLLSNDLLIANYARKHACGLESKVSNSFNGHSDENAVDI